MIKSRGFTIVELLIVIVVIGILAAITVVAYSGIQQRARDTQRVSDMSTLLKLLESYKTLNGVYPTATGDVGNSGYEQSNDTSTPFMEALQAAFATKVPLDPTNSSSHYYRYYRYNIASLSSYGCPSDKGGLVVLFAVGFENAANMPQSDPALVCTSTSWTGSPTTYFKYRFENG